MENINHYNTSKRKLEKLTGILGVVFSSISLLSFLFSLVFVWLLEPFIVVDISTASAWRNVVEICVCIALVILFALIIKTPVKADGTLRKRLGIRIAILVLSVLTFNVFMTIMMIVLLTLKDFDNEQNVKTEKIKMPKEKKVKEKKIKEKKSKEKKKDNNSKPETVHNIEMSTDEKVAALKNLKRNGVIDADTYTKLVKQILVKLLKD